MVGVAFVEVFATPDEIRGDTIHGLTDTTHEGVVGVAGYDGSANKYVSIKDAKHLGRNIGVGLKVDFLRCHK